MDLQFLINLSARLRIHVIEATNESKSGHPTSCSSLADIFAVLFFHQSGMKYLPKDPQNINNDKLVLSKGHAAPLLYAAWAETGLFPISHLKTLRKFDSDLEGHPTTRADFVDVATGSLGQGISAACGMAFSMKFYEKRKSFVFTVLGDAECAEGSVWEAANFAAFYKLNNLVAIIDINGYGQSVKTMFSYEVSQYQNRFQSFGWETIVINGHNFEEIIQAFTNCRRFTKPVVILANTIKGKDFIGIQHIELWHGKPLGAQGPPIILHLQSKIQTCPQVFQPSPPEILETFPVSKLNFRISPAAFDISKKISTRTAFGISLAELGADERIVCLDGDTRNSTMSSYFSDKYPSRFIECFIAEQNLVGVALGLSKRGKVPFVSLFSAFFTRAFDHLRIAAISKANIKFIGSHSGISAGEDGASQMGLEDISMFRSLPGSIILYPCDSISTYYSLLIASNFQGIVYIRTSRPNVPTIYHISEFSLRSYAIKKSKNDALCIVTAGITIHESIKAWTYLKTLGISIRILDLFCIQPLDVKRLAKNAKKSGNQILTVEDHYLPGGIFESVCGGLSNNLFKISGLWVKEIPRSGPSETLLEYYGISASCIIGKVKALLSHPHI